MKMNNSIGGFIIFAIKNNGILTLPTLTDTLVSRKSIDILENKTLNNPVINKIYNNNKIINIPLLLDISDTFVLQNNEMILNNKGRWIKKLV